jgi:hypothetical protein
MPAIGMFRSRSTGHDATVVTRRGRSHPRRWTLVAFTDGPILALRAGGRRCGWRGEPDPRHLDRRHREVCAIEPAGAKAMNQEELAEVMQEVLDALRDGDVDSATARAGKAVRLAHDAGNGDVLERLSKLVEIDDRATAKLCPKKPKKKVDDLDVMIFETRSVTSRRSKPAQLHALVGAEADRCATCGLSQDSEVHYLGDTGRGGEPA